MARTLLIVDDVSLNREILKKMLSGEYALMEATNGEEALDVLMHNHAHISAVLLDISMPKMDGYEVLRRMRSHVLLAAIPVIMITGSESEEARVKALGFGANDFVMKPYSAEIIRHCLRNNIAFREAAATVDALQRDRVSGLYNREAFFDRVKHAVAQHEAGYYIMASFDIEQFKVINDQYGTEKGDEVLRHVGDVFAGGFDPQGGICCRVAADDFAVLYPASFRDSPEIARIRHDAAHVEDIIFPIIFKIGRYVVDEPQLSPAAMYDRAMLAASTIKGRYDEAIAVYSETMRQRLLHEQEIVTEMAFALESRQFEVWYQPQYNHATDAMVGAEALVRWRHPQKGLIPPANFIPIFEQNGFIYQMDKFVWEEVCRKLRDWLDKGRGPLPVSVNISRYDVFREDIVETICELVHRYDLPVELLRLEVTESAFAESPQRVISVVKELVRRGFTVEIDDFGSGYSSLNTLKDVPAQILKLDMRFFENSGDSQRGGNIVESVVRMAKWLGMSVIAEGVEMLAQANLLLSIGCQYIQGYLYARPMPAEEYEAHCGGCVKEEKLLALETVENLDNSAFWDAHSMDTLIFNSYVGAACILEYHNGKMEVIRATEKYAQAIGGESMTVADALKLNWAEYLAEEDGARLFSVLEESIRTKKEITAEYRFLHLPGRTGETYLRSTMRVIATAGDRCLVYCTNENITAQKHAEQREREVSRQMQAIMDNVDLGIITAVLENGAARYLFANDRYYQMLGYTKEEFAVEVTSVYQTIAADDLAMVREKTEALNRTGGSTALEYNANTRSGTRRIFRAIISMGTWAGMDKPVQMTILRDITEEKELQRREHQAAAQIQNMMDDMPGGFVRMQLNGDGAIRPIYFNKGFFKLTGMDHDALLALYADDAMAGVHPEDTEIVKRAVAEMITRGEGRSARYRLRHGGDGYIWVMFFGRMTKNPQGETFLNVYYSDATQEVEAEQQSKKLLDNLPYGAGLYTLEGDTLRIVHLNKRYWELVNRKESDCTGDDFFKAVCPEDHGVIFREVHLAAAEQRDIVCDIRILYGDQGYRPFHIVGRVLPGEDGTKAIYAVYTPITSEAMSVQEMLPIALSTMMDTQAGYSFVKDRGLRYICCSCGAAALLGLPSSMEMQGKSDEELLGKALAAEFAAEDRLVMESGEARVDIVSHIPSPGGTVRYASTSKYPLKDAAGNIVGLYGVGRDITENRAIKSQYELLTNSIPGGIATYEARGGEIRMTFYNDGLCKLFGMSRASYAAITNRNVFAGVFGEDLPRLKQELADFLRSDTQIDCVFRVHLLGGGYKWINFKAAFPEHEADKTVFNAVLFDVTESQNAMEHLRISEEENRLAMQHTSNTVCRYDVTGRTLRIPKRACEVYQMPESVENMPDSQIRDGLISPETAAEYKRFYEEIHGGQKTGSVIFQRLSPRGWRWIEGHYSTIFSDAGEAVSAVISFVDVTEQLEKDLAYKRWKQSLLDKEPDSYSLFRYNLTTGKYVGVREGSLLPFSEAWDAWEFSDSAAKYCAECVFGDDAERFSAQVNTDALLAEYYRGKRIVTLEYRQCLTGDSPRWLRLTVDMVEQAGSADVEAYLLFEDIDRVKRQELATIEQAQTDPLTGVLNRNTFAAKVGELIKTARPGVQHALMMLDIDGFKKVNDAFGHSTGDQALIDIAAALRATLRHSDLIGRLGGDEYLLFLPDLPGDVIATVKARQICAAVRRSFSAEVEISGSIGIAITPRDGEDFDTLYKKADAALYHVKGLGKDSFAFYNEDMADQHLTPEADQGVVVAVPKRKKRRMLIVDDSRIDHALLSNIFDEDFIIEKAKSGSDALVRLRHYGTAISVVLLDLMMPGMDGFTVLKKMQESTELQCVPVVVVSGDDSRETSLRAIRAGAVDFVNKPVDPDVLRIRVESAISKAENEHLRAQNSLLEYQNSEIARYRNALENCGVVTVENDWVAGTFIYDSSISHHLAGRYDNRGLWHILLSDFVAETFTVHDMQNLVQEVASDHTQRTAQLDVRLKGADGKYHQFRFNVTKKVNNFGLAGKIYMTFLDLG